MQRVKPPTKHQLKSEATRVALLQAAEMIFARDGYERAQIDEIAKESGRTRGAVYAQYKTKEQLFFAVQEQRFEAGVQDVLELTRDLDESDYQSRMEAVKQYYSEIHDPQAAILDIELKLYALRHPESAEDWRKRYLQTFVQNDFSQLFGIRQGDGRSELGGRVLALAALKGGLLLASFFLPEPFPAKETKLILLEVFDGLFPLERVSKS